MLVEENRLCVTTMDVTVSFDCTRVEDISRQGIQSPLSVYCEMEERE